MTESNEWKGGCACGAIRFESSAEPTFSFHCHCRQCQRASGGGHSSAFVVPANSVSITGKLKFFDQQSDRGNTVSRGFCPDCGSPMLNKNSAYPDNFYINAAALDDPGVFKPTTVVFGDAAQPWDYIDPNIR